MVQIILQGTSQTDLGAPVTSLRLFKMGRMLKLIKTLKGLQSIFKTLLSTLPSFGNIGLLLFLLIYVYSIIGINLFGTVTIHGAMNSYANFQNFPNAFLTLIRCATGEGWNELMSAFMDERSVSMKCIYNPTYQDYL